jgi:hypothetical protein
LTGVPKTLSGASSKVSVPLGAKTGLKVQVPVADSTSVV